MCYRRRFTRPGGISSSLRVFNHASKSFCTLWWFNNYGPGSAFFTKCLALNLSLRHDLRLCKYNDCHTGHLCHTCSRKGDSSVCIFCQWSTIPRSASTKFYLHIKSYDLPNLTCIQMASGVNAANKGHLMALSMSYLTEDLFCLVGVIMERTRSSSCVAVRNNNVKNAFYLCVS